jgi:hypothetical protein
MRTAWSILAFQLRLFAPGVGNVWLAFQDAQLLFMGLSACH